MASEIDKTIEEQGKFAAAQTFSDGVNAGAFAFYHGIMFVADMIKDAKTPEARRQLLLELDAITKQLPQKLNEHGR